MGAHRPVNMDKNFLPPSLFDLLGKLLFRFLQLLTLNTLDQYDKKCETDKNECGKKPVVHLRLLQIQKTILVSLYDISNLKVLP